MQSKNYPPAHSAVTKRGWRVGEWCRDTGLGKTTVFALIAEGSVDSVKVGRARIITTAPGDFLAQRAGA
jgi:hypothetical protein